ncbi:MAG: class I SAM-dependent methyltransferase [Candidatus Omnitrophica bacterium]|nr:class I SAM-dependent methyltransferase [Candidatus Omnitrophota bacterium]
MVSRLKGFYGDVARRQNFWIASEIAGKKVLDVGCGYGLLVDFLRRQDYDVTGVDLDEDSLTHAARLFPKSTILHLDGYDLPYADESFDTVIFRESIHHMDREKAFREAARLAKYRIIVFDPNPSPWIKFCRKLAKHVDEETSFKEVTEALKQTGLSIKRAEFLETFAFPASGGFVGTPLIPNWAWFKKMILGLDAIVTRGLQLAHLDRLFCWRFLITADKTKTAKSGYSPSFLHPSHSVPA